ncbi:MAG: hypothetical protein VB080_13650 [Propionicimonas sp.]|uniref:PTS sugar transporter subunit IIA n=1 Tax=Propionicimonas sp. TaxID=1955623 RepID=UPI002B2122B8|nr:hypothetical protein [Propionicimonas sp.]MEA4945466.1 hypothetical protein [Propionicimonas sp.]MEA5053034.1 hypothetical protein [Propionicimonas sp.]MEA5117437.1 hypothetical protein [Propionicimonas sp.]
MTRILLASHGRLADGMRDSLTMIIGPVDALESFCAYTTPGEDVPQEVRQYVEGIDPDDELLVVTDLFGGSITNEFQRYLGTPGLHIVAGMNLALVLELVTGRDRPVKDLLSDVITNARSAIRCLEPTTEVLAAEDF